MLTLQALTCFEGNNDQNGGTIWSCASSLWHPLKKARPKSKPDCVIQSTAGECVPMQAVKQPVTLESFDHIKLRLLRVKTYTINGKDVEGSTDRKLGSTKQRNMYLMYVYKTTSRFTFVLKYKLIILLTFIFARRHSPSKKQPINLFTQFWKFTDFKPIKKKIDVTLILSIIAKEKSERIAKSEKLFWFLTILIAFVIAYIFSIMRAGFSMANTCVRK